MTSSVKRVRRFALLEQLQKSKVERAGQQLQASLMADNQAAEKLASLEAYFDAEFVEPRTAVYAVNLSETGVFRSRLQDAVAAQRGVCERLKQQREFARQSLMKAEERRAGLGKVRSEAQRRLERDAEKIEQQQSEDASIARFSRRVTR